MLGEAASPERLASRVIGIRKEHWIYAASFVAVAAAWVLMRWRDLVGGLLALTAGAAVLGIVWYALARCEKVERDRMLVVLLLTAVSVVFWTLFEQAGTSMTLFTERNVETSLFGIEMQAAQMGFVNPAFIILLAPAFAMLWDVLSKRGIEPSTPMKFGLGVLQAGLGFLVLVVGASFADTLGQVAVAWLVLAYLLHTTGELCLSPVGLSMVTRLSAVKVVGSDDGRLVSVGCGGAVSRRLDRGFRRRGPSARGRHRSARLATDLHRYVRHTGLGRRRDRRRRDATRAAGQPAGPRPQDRPFFSC